MELGPIWPTIPCTDFERAKGFYVDKLGLKVSKDMPEMEMAMFDTGGQSGFVLFKRGPFTCDHTVAGWAVEDVEAAVKDLADKGVTFEQYPELKTDEMGISRMGGGMCAWFKDTEGNILSVNSKM